MSDNDCDDPVIIRVREVFEQLEKEKKWTLEQLGIAMGYEADTARKSAFQFLHVKVPRIDTLRKFSEAVGISLAELVSVPVVEPVVKKYQRAAGK